MKKKQNIIEAATHLFAVQGFDGTSTLQIVKKAKVTEPLLYYHFKGKEDLFTHIFNATFQEYFSQLESLDKKTKTEFEKIENLITLHFQFVEEIS